nr:fimbrial protein [uncultured Erwinia sp.]
MQRNKGTQCNPLVNERLSRSIRIAVAAAILTLLTPISSPVLAADNWKTEGMNGVIHVHGSLMESSCRLATSSAWQDIEIGNVSTARLQHIGDRGTPVKIELKLEDCASSASRMSDSDTGNVTWSRSQPSVSVSFQAPMDADNPQLIKVSGAGGLGLRLKDMLGRDVRVGGHGTPLQLTPGKNQLIYTIVPERTRATLAAGNWWSLINIGLNYE